VSEEYAGRQVVGIDLHRRRSVIVRMTESGERLETVRILNDRKRSTDVMSRAEEVGSHSMDRPAGHPGAGAAPGEAPRRLGPAGALSSCAACRRTARLAA